MWVNSDVGGGSVALQDRTGTRNPRAGYDDFRNVIWLDFLMNVDSDVTADVRVLNSR